MFRGARGTMPGVGAVGLVARRRPRRRRASGVRGSGRLTRWAKDRRRPPAGSPRAAVDAVGRCGPLVAAAVRRHRRVVGVVAPNGRVALPPPARPAGLPVVPAGRVYHAPPLTTRVVVPSPVLVVKLTVCGKFAPRRTSRPCAFRRPSVCLVVSSLLGWVPRRFRTEPEYVHTANNDRRLTNSNARVVIPLLSQRHAFLFAGRSWTRLGSSYRPGSGRNADGTAVIRA